MHGSVFNLVKVSRILLWILQRNTRTQSKMRRWKLLWSKRLRRTRFLTCWVNLSLGRRSIQVKMIQPWILQSSSLTKTTKLLRRNTIINERYIKVVETWRSGPNRHRIRSKVYGGVEWSWTLLSITNYRSNTDENENHQLRYQDIPFLWAYTTGAHLIVCNYYAMYILYDLIVLARRCGFLKVVEASWVYEP